MILSIKNINNTLNNDLVFNTNGDLDWCCNPNNRTLCITHLYKNN